MMLHPAIFSPFFRKDVCRIRKNKDTKKELALNT
jgi:hypothetical protein